LDAWQIERENEINTELVSDAIAAGHAIRGDDNLTVGGVVVPNTGTLLAVTTQYFNSTSTKVRGLDLDVRQKFDLNNAGSLSLDLQWTHISSFERIDGASTIQWAGTHGNCDVSNCIGTPKDRINFGVTWDYNKLFSISSIVNYRGKMDNVFEEGDTTCAVHFADGTDAPNGCKVPSFYTIDLSATWNPSDSWQVFGSVANVTDKIAPLDPLTYGAVNYNPLDYSGAIGRYYTVGMKYTFN
jgi:iron complex outermembrane receptor protein